MLFAAESLGSRAGVVRTAPTRRSRGSRAQRSFTHSTVSALLPPPQPHSELVVSPARGNRWSRHADRRRIITTAGADRRPGAQ